MSRRDTNAPKGDGLDAANIQPANVKKHTANFIANLRDLADSFYVIKEIDATFLLCCVVLLAQAVLMALARVL